MKFKSVVLLICQTFVSIGFGFGVMNVAIMQVDGGSQILAQVYGSPTVPHIIVILLICFMGTLGITSGNIMSMEIKTETKTEDN